MARKRFTAIWTCFAILWLGAAAVAQTGETYRTRLSVVPITVAMQDTVAGSGSVTATLTGRRLTVTGTFEGLRSPATVARIHLATRGIRGPAILDLTVTKATSGSISGSLDLTPAQVEELRNSRFYVQLHSERAPDGNLWGWLVR
jgi:hypothetical protein